MLHLIIYTWILLGINEKIPIINPPSVYFLLLLLLFFLFKGNQHSEFSMWPYITSWIVMNVLSLPAFLWILGVLSSNLFPFLFLCVNFYNPPPCPSRDSGTWVSESHHPFCPPLQSLHSHSQPCSNLLTGVSSPISTPYTGDANSRHKTRVSLALSFLSLQIYLLLYLNLLAGAPPPTTLPTLWGSHLLMWAASL